MHYLERAGRTPVVVCVHGFCQSSAYWAPTLERLADSGVGGIAVDLPGFGASADAPGPYTMEAYADAIAALLDARGLTRVIVAGGSMGGVVAQHFALRHPERLARLLLVATGAFTADPAAALAKADQMEAGPWSEQAIAAQVNGFFHHLPPPERIAFYRRIVGMADRRAAVAAARSNANSRTFERLGAIAVPTLIIQGRQDRGRTPEHGAAMRDRIPGARLVILEGSGHTPQLEEPEAFHAVALPFLSGAG
jgi:pimeloyl-ACP methyl ester carboxylesterase